MTHSDDDGLIIPPRIAPVQVVIIPIFTNDSERAETKAFAESIAERLHSRLDRLKVVIDHRDDLRPAEKFFHWLQQGIPVRIEVGPRDVAKQCGMVARRDVREKESIELESITASVIFSKKYRKISSNVHLSSGSKTPVVQKTTKSFVRL